MCFFTLRLSGLVLCFLLSCAVQAAGLQIAWDDNSSSETGFAIERSTDGTNFSQLATVPAGTTSYFDTSVVTGTCYWYRVTAFNATTTSPYSNVASGIALVAAVAPTISTQPVNQTVTAGGTLSLSVTATGTPAPIYQWSLNGILISGATSSTLVRSTVTSTDAGTYKVAVTNSAGSVVSSGAVVTVSTSNSSTSTSSTSTSSPSDSGSSAGRLSSLSAQAISAPWGAAALQINYTITGGAKSLVLRAVGPGLAPYLTGTLLSDPLLKVSKGTTVVASDDNWGGTPELTAAFDQVGAFPLPATSKDSALMMDFPAGSYLAALTGKASGWAMAELYDAASTTTSRISRITARGSVGKGTAMLTAGFVISGDTPVRILIRAIGPSLSGLPDILNNPKLQLYHGSVLLRENDDWGGTTALADLFKSVGASALNARSRDAAIDVTLAPGVYSAVISPANSDTGIAQIEFYPVP